MLEFSQRNTTENSTNQWKKYLEYDMRFTNMLENGIEGTSFQKLLERNCILDSIPESGKDYAKTVCGSFQNGIEFLNSTYSSLKEDLYWRNSLKFDAALLSNIIVSDMSFLSEQLNWKEDKIELLKVAFLEYYSLVDGDKNACSALKKFLELDKLKPENYYLQYKIGMLYLFSPSCLDIEQAEFFFKKSIHNSMAKHSSFAIQLTKHTLPEDTSIRNINDLVRFYTAESYYRYGILSYIKGDFDNCFKNTVKTCNINADHRNALYLQAKVLAHQHKMQDVIQILNKLSKTTSVYAVKTVFDHDFCSKTRLAVHFDEVRKVNVSMVYNLLNLLKKKMIRGSITEAYIERIENSLKVDDSYLSSFNALRLSKDKQLWEIHNLVIDTTSKPIVLQAHKSPVSALDFHPYLNLLVSASWDSSVIEWNLKNQKIRKHYRGFRGEVYCTVYSSSGKYIVAATSEGHVKLIDSSESAVIKDWDFGKCSISSACFSNDDKLIYFGCSDKQIRIIDRKTDTITSIKTSDPVTALIHCHNSEGIFWGENSGVIHFQNEATQSKSILKEHTESITALALNSSDTKLVSAADDKKAIIWNLSNNQKLTTISSIGIKIHDIDFSPNDTLFAAACSDNFTRLYNLSGREIAKYSGHKISVEAVRMQKTGNILATAGYDKNVKLWGKFIVNKSFEVSLRDIVSIELKNAKNLEAYESNSSRIKETTDKCILIEGREYFEAARDEERKQNKRFGSKDYEKAAQLYRKALEYGIAEAEEKVKELEEKQ